MGFLLGQSQFLKTGVFGGHCTTYFNHFKARFPTLLALSREMIKTLFSTA